MVKWSELTKSLEQGGLGLRRVKVVNSCLLIKWWWRFGYEKNALWRSVICSKYKVDFRDWIPSPTSTNNMFSVWKGIITIAKSNSTLLEYYLNNFQIKIGNGNNVCF